MQLNELHTQLVDRTAGNADIAGLQVTEISLRHRTLRQVNAAGQGHIAKVEGCDDGSVAREHAVITALRDQPVAELLPDVVSFDRESGALTLDLVPSAVTFREAMARSPDLPGVIASQLGRAIGLIHRADPAVLGSVVGPGEEIAVARFPDADAPLLEAMSSASRQLLETVQTTEGFGAQLWALFPMRPLAVIHNDLKWDNVLVYPAPERDLGFGIKVIDWEMAGVGDPCWDVGTVLSEFLAFWALSIPVVGGEPVDRYMDLAKYPVEGMQPAIRAFWHGYAEARAFDPVTTRERLVRSTRYAGARLIQTAFERTQTMSGLSPQIYLLLQLSLNIMEQPEDAAEHLLGIAPA